MQWVNKMHVQEGMHQRTYDLLSDVSTCRYSFWQDSGGNIYQRAKSNKAENAAMPREKNMLKRLETNDLHYSASNWVAYSQLFL